MNQPSDTTPAAPPPGLAIFAGFASLFIGIGLARFGYTPLLPAVIEAGWFPPAEAAYLGAANFAGYLAGAVLAWRIPIPLSPRTTLRMLLAATAISFAASAVPLSFEWMAFLRFLPGLTGGWIMVLAAPLVLTAIPEERQRLAGAILFAGVASGIVASGTLVPVLLVAGLEEAWLGIACLMALLIAFAWRGIPAGEVEVPAEGLAGAADLTPAMAGLAVAYSLVAAGICAHMLFFVDYIARGLGHGIATGSIFWIVIGASGLAGPLVSAAAGRHFGMRRTLLVSLVALSAGNGIAAVSDGLISAFISAVLVGGLLTGLSAVVLGIITETIAARKRRMRMWGLATGGFAIAQAAASYVYSWMFGAGFGYDALFLAAAGAGILAFAAILASEQVSKRR